MGSSVQTPVDSGISDERPELFCVLAESDAWSLVCHICGLPIREDDEAQWDHLWPKSLGGCDWAHNMRRTHPQCNNSRKVRLPAQLPLVPRELSFERRYG